MAVVVKALKTSIITAVPSAWRAPLSRLPTLISILVPRALTEMRLRSERARAHAVLPYVEVTGPHYLR